MTATVATPDFVVFYSKQLAREYCSADLASLEEEQLQILLLEAHKVASECLSEYEWSKSSSPSEWPDEDWPRRVRKKGSLVNSFAKSVKAEIKWRRQKRHLEALQFKAEALQLKAARVAKAQAERFTRMRYIRAALRERFGHEIARDVLARAAEMQATASKDCPSLLTLNLSSQTDYPHGKPTHGTPA